MKRLPKEANECTEIILGRHISLKHPNYLLGSAQEAFYSYQANCFMIYMGSPQTSFRKKVDDLKVEEFKRFLLEKRMEIKNVIVHASYLINLGNFGDKNKLSYSIDLLKKDFKMMDEIGLKTIVIHPGSSLNLDRRSSLLSVSRSLDLVFSSSENVRVALETMSGSGNQLGKNFEEIDFIIKNSNFKSRIGVCWDTCHLYSSGYDIKNNLNSVIQDFDKIIGIDKLWVIHLNDSAFEISSKKDRHSNIGSGFLGLKCIASISHHELFFKVIKILETPTVDYNHKNEIKLIKNYFKTTQS